MVKLHFTKENMPTPEEFRRMLDEALARSNPIDELLELLRDLVAYEEQYNMASEEFYERFMRGELGDAGDYISWAGYYETYLRFKHRIGEGLKQVLAA